MGKGGKSRGKDKSYVDDTSSTSSYVEADRKGQRSPKGKPKGKTSEAPKGKGSGKKGKGHGKTGEWHEEDAYGYNTWSDEANYVPTGKAKGKGKHKGKALPKGKTSEAPKGKGSGKKGKGQGKTGEWHDYEWAPKGKGKHQKGYEEYGWADSGWYIPPAHHGWYDDVWEPKGKGKKGKGKKGKGKGKERMPDPPVDDPGRWVHADDSLAPNKSFGFFRCSCGKTWVSAHGYKDYRQECQGCEDSSWPIYLWLNEHKKVGFDAEDEERKARREAAQSHDEARCEACRKGVCSFQKQRYSY